MIVCLFALSFGQLLVGMLTCSFVVIPFFAASILGCSDASAPALRFATSLFSFTLPFCLHFFLLYSCSRAYFLLLSFLNFLSVIPIHLSAHVRFY